MSEIWSNRSRFFLSRIVASSSGAGGETLWIPSYFCEDALMPLRKRGQQIVFYPVGSDLQPDWSWCAARASVQKPRWFLLCHYFGLPNDCARARDFCGQFECQLIEDGAHLSGPCGSVGVAGDFVFFSLYKIFGGRAGSVLFTKQGLASRQSAGDEPIRRVWIRGGDFVDLARGLMPEGLKKRIRRWTFGAKATGLEDFTVDPPSQDWIHSNVSEFRKWFLSRRFQRHAHFIVRRRKRLTRWLKFCERNGLDQFVWRKMINAAPDQAPFRLVLRAGNAQSAETLARRLRSGGIEVSSWPTLPPEIRAEPEIFGEAIRWRETTLLVSIDARPPRDLPA